MVFIGIMFVIKTRKNAIYIEYLDYQILVTHVKGQNGNKDMQSAKRDLNAPHTPDFNTWLCVRSTDLSVINL